MFEQRDPNRQAALLSARQASIASIGTGAQAHFFNNGIDLLFGILNGIELCGVMEGFAQGEVGPVFVVLLDYGTVCLENVVRQGNTVELDLSVRLSIESVQRQGGD